MTIATRSSIVELIVIECIINSSPLLFHFELWLKGLPFDSALEMRAADRITRAMTGAYWRAHQASVRHQPRRWFLRCRISHATISSYRSLRRRISGNVKRLAQSKFQEDSRRMSYRLNQSTPPKFNEFRRIFMNFRVFG
jgi:hypothetical protein